MATAEDAEAEDAEAAAAIEAAEAVVSGGAGRRLLFVVGCLPHLLASASRYYVDKKRAPLPAALDRRRPKRCVLTRVGDTANNWDQKGFQVGLGVNLR